ncbi:acetyltransferase [Ilyonectria sp. MPI-CAGE-AT-0026]|nr:acetyltransferase [Ilyonectria sp. MPI-CAGE-AT-0026]
MASSHQTKIKMYGETNIRHARASDATAIAELGAYVFSATFAHSVQPNELQQFLDESYTTAAVTKDINDPKKNIIVITNSDDEIIGFAYLTRGSSEPCIVDLTDTVELQRIYVHPSTHGRGIGSLLVSEIEKMAREQGFKHIWLGVWEENNNAIRAYQKWGYKQVGDHDFVIGSIVQTDHIMLKEL